MTVLAVFGSFISYIYSGAGARVQWGAAAGAQSVVHAMRGRCCVCLAACRTPLATPACPDLPLLQRRP